jgi:hypothetical protein
MLVLDMIGNLPPMEKYKYNNWRIPLTMKYSASMFHGLDAPECNM